MAKKKREVARGSENTVMERQTNVLMCFDDKDLIRGMCFRSLQCVCFED